MLVNIDAFVQSFPLFRREGGGAQTAGSLSSIKCLLQAT